MLVLLFSQFFFLSAICIIGACKYLKLFLSSASGERAHYSIFNILIFQSQLTYNITLVSGEQHSEHGG